MPEFCAKTEHKICLFVCLFRCQATISNVFNDIWQCLPSGGYVYYITNHKSFFSGVKYTVILILIKYFRYSGQFLRLKFKCNF